MRVVADPSEIGNCGCGRSPNGKCIGWHGLTEEAYQAALNEWKASQANGSGQPTDFTNQKKGTRI